MRDVDLTQIGKVTHYYDKISVAVIALSQTLKIGDKIKFSGHDKEFSQTVESIQMEHQQIDKAKKGEEVGLKVNEPVKPGDSVYMDIV